jgi:hypothetical protein
MTHPIIALQAALLAAFAADAELIGFVGEGGVLDAPARGRSTPYVALARHDIAPRDGDETPGHAHRIVLHVWPGQPSRKAALAVVERLLAVALSAALAPEGLLVTLRRHERTETSIDSRTGQARAALVLVMFTEPG